MPYSNDMTLPESVVFLIHPMVPMRLMDKKALIDEVSAGKYAHLDINSENVHQFIMPDHFTNALIHQIHSKADVDFGGYDEAFKDWFDECYLPPISHHVDDIFLTEAWLCRVDGRVYNADAVLQWLSQSQSSPFNAQPMSFEGRSIWRHPVLKLMQSCHAENKRPLSSVIHNALSLHSDDYHFVFRGNLVKNFDAVFHPGESTMIYYFMMELIYLYDVAALLVKFDRYDEGSMGFLAFSAVETVLVTCASLLACQYPSLTDIEPNYVPLFVNPFYAPTCLLGLNLVFRTILLTSAFKFKQQDLHDDFISPFVMHFLSPLVCIKLCMLITTLELSMNQFYQLLISIRCLFMRGRANFSSDFYLTSLFGLLGLLPAILCFRLRVNSLELLEHLHGKENFARADLFFRCTFFDTEYVLVTPTADEFIQELFFITAFLKPVLNINRSFAHVCHQSMLLGLLSLLIISSLLRYIEPPLTVMSLPLPWLAIRTVEIFYQWLSSSLPGDRPEDILPLQRSRVSQSLFYAPQNPEDLTASPNTLRVTAI